MEETVRVALRQSLNEVSYELRIMNSRACDLLFWVEILEPKLEKGLIEKMLDRLEFNPSAILHP